MSRGDRHGRPLKKAPELLRGLFASLLIALGFVLGLLLTRTPLADPNVAVTMRQRRPSIPGFGGRILDLFGNASLTWYACIVSLPLFLWLARRFPITRATRARGTMVHAAALAVVVSLTTALHYALLVPRGVPGPPLATFLGFQVVRQLLPFLAMIAVIHALEFHRRFREREVESARLEAQLARARLDALAAQLQPHFLFNTLQGVSTLMHRDVRAADAMLARLSDLLRRALEAGKAGRHEVTLGEELALLEDYVAIARERFGDRLAVTVSAPDELREARVPFFLLQPLVENAMEHGIARRAGGGRIAVSVARQGDRLAVSVADDGPGVAVGAEAAEGIGLANTRSRLAQLYGDAQSVTISRPRDGGFRVDVVIPCAS